MQTLYPRSFFVFAKNTGPFNFMSSPSAYKYFDTIWLDLLQNLSELFDCSKNNARSTDLLTSSIRFLIKMSTWFFCQSIYITKLRLGMYHMTLFRDVYCFDPLTFDVNLKQKLTSKLKKNIQTYLEKKKEHI